MEQKPARISLETIVSFLSNLKLLKQINQSTLLDLANLLQPIFVEGGSTLIRQGDLDTTMYILFQGRLRVHKFVETPLSSQEIVIAEISVGEFVGEIALLTHLPRTSTVKVVRDSILLKLDEEAYKHLEERHPSEVLEISKIALKRLAVKSRATQIGEDVPSIVIAPAGHSDHRHFARILAEKLNAIKPTILISKETSCQHFGSDITGPEGEGSSHERLIDWLYSLEHRYHYVVYETDHENTPWTQQCLRQADRLILAADHSNPPSLNAIEEQLFSDRNKILPYTELAFLHPEEGRLITGTGEWFKNRRFNGYHHLTLNSEKQIDRYIRFLTNRAFGLVLSGGSARGFSHIGVLKALDELKIPIDYIAGSSMGAVIAAGYAARSFSEIVDSAKQFSYNSKMEWTLPLMSLTTGKYLSDFFYEAFEDVRIEDLWNRFFCVSTNITQGKLHTYDEGPIWLALRASTSIPAMYPPIFSDSGDMLVDGGILNNLPVDVMRKMLCGGKILAISCNEHPIQIAKHQLPSPWVSGWQLFFQNMNPFSKKKIEYENILTVLLSSFDLSASPMIKEMESHADYILKFSTNQFGSFDFPRIEEIIDFGYQTAMKELPALLKI